MPKLSIIIPCFNEEKTIGEVVQKVEAAALPQNWQKEIIIVDDYSTDNTREKIAEHAGRYVIVLRNENGGKGAALKSGMKKATGDFILIQDADLEYNPNDYQRLISALGQKHTVVFGSRLRQKNDYFSLTYLYGSKFLTKTFNLFFGSKFTDITSCYKLFPRQAIGRLTLYPENDFVFDAVCLTYELNRLGNNITEIPINYFPRSREEGKKVNWRHGLKCLIKIAEIRTGEYWQFFKFIVTGGIAFVINLSALYFFVGILGGHYLISSVCSFLLAAAANFALQKFWTFGTKHGNIYAEAPLFLVLQVTVNLFLNTWLLYIFVEHLHLWYLLSQAMISLGLAVATFFFSRKYIFKKPTV